METLETIAGLKSLLAEREGRTVLFKHSTRCPLSASAIREFEAVAAGHPDAARYVYLDLIAHRDVSDEIEKRLGVPHQSPQAIVLEGGSVRAVFNHFEVKRDVLAGVLES